jgi:phage N-6-adenine-methyltransferase
MNAPGHVRRADNAAAPQTWSTPPALIAALERRYAPDGFDLDTAADAHNAVAEHWLGHGSSIGEDALTVPWLVPGWTPGAVFCNPPWNAIEPFVAHAIAEVEAGHCAVVVLVLPTRADTRWWAMLERAPVVVQRDQIEGRVAYVDPLGTGRSAPAEGTTVWVLRPVLRATEVNPKRSRRSQGHEEQPTLAADPVKTVEITGEP